MNTLRLNEKEIVEFSPDFFDEDTLRGFLDFAPEAVSLAEAEEVSRDLRARAIAERPRRRRRVVRPLKEMSLDRVFRTVFDDLQADEDFGGYVQENREALERDVEKDFVARVGRRIKPKVFKHNMDTFQVDRTVSRGVVSLTINGQPALSYREADITAARASALQTLIAWCKLIWDTIGFIGSVLEIYTPKADSKRVKAITRLVDRAKSTWARFVDKMMEIRLVSNASAMIDVIMDAIEIRDIAKLGLDVAKAMWRSMSWREWLWAVAQFSAALVLMFVTAGVTLIQKLIRAAAKLVNVIQDVIDIINLRRGSTALQRAAA